MDKQETMNGLETGYGMRVLRALVGGRAATGETTQRHVSEWGAAGAVVRRYANQDGVVRWSVDVLAALREGGEEERERGRLRAEEEWQCSDWGEVDAWKGATDDAEDYPEWRDLRAIAAAAAMASAGL